MGTSAPQDAIKDFYPREDVLVMDQAIAQVRQEAKRQTARSGGRRVFMGQATKEKKK